MFTKVILLLLSALPLFQHVSAADPKLCTLPILENAPCSGFQVINKDVWDDFLPTEDAPQEDAEFLCCATTEEDCCLSYTPGYYAGFAIGVAGLVLMALVCAAQLACRSSNKSSSDEDEA